MNSSYLKVLLIFIAQVCAGSSVIMLTMLSGIIGLKLSPTPFLATLPNSATVLGTVAGSLIFVYLINKYGWKKSILSGLCVGIFATFIASFSLLNDNFFWYVISCFMIGYMAASVQFYIYAAAREASNERNKGFIISLITSSGLFSALISPELIKRSRDIFPSTEFIGAFIGLFSLLIIAVIIFILLPYNEESTERRKINFKLVNLKTLESNALTGIVISISAFVMMTLIMHGSPVAMSHEGYSSETSSYALQWHFIAMYAPSLLVGLLISKYSVKLTILIGILFSVLAVISGLVSVSVSSFNVTLVMIGVAWSMLFISGTTIISSLPENEEKVKIQGFSNLLTYASSAVASVSAAPVFITFGWKGLCTSATIPILLCILCMLYMMSFRGKKKNG